MGLTTSVRSLYGPLIVLVLGWMLLRLWRSRKGHSSQVTSLAAGAAIGLAPIAYCFFGDPRLLVFNNVGYYFLWRTAPDALFRFFDACIFEIRLLVFRIYWLLLAVLFVLGVAALHRQNCERQAPDQGSIS